MSSKPPFFRQGRSDTCALACLRMLLAQHGLDATEEELLLTVTMEPGGVDIEELARSQSTMVSGPKSSDSRWIP